MSDTFYDVSRESDPPELSYPTRMLIRIAGEDPEFIAQKCPGDVNNLTAAGAIGLGSFCFNATVFSIVGAHLSGGFNVGIPLVAIGTSAFILAIDSYTFNRCAQMPSGFEQLQQSGHEISVPRKVRRMIRRSLGIRLLQSVSLGLLAAILTSLIVYKDDIAARIRLNSQQGNSSIIQQLNEQASTDIKRANDAVAQTIASLKRVDIALSRGNTLSGKQERELTGQKNTNEKVLTAQKAELARLQASRNERLRAALESDPSAFHGSKGILAQLNGLEQLAGDDWKVILFILLLEFVTVGFDLALVQAKSNWLPTESSVLRAREYLERMQRTVDEMAPVGPGDDPDGRPKIGAANDNNAFPVPLKRKRGRPPKYPLVSLNGSGELLPQE